MAGGAGMEYLTQFIVMLLMGLIVREIAGDISWFSHWLVHTAARKLPAEERERFIDENLADIDAIEGPFSKLYNALGCFSAASSLTSELAATSSSPNKAYSRKSLLAIPLLGTAIWCMYVSFRGLTDFFDLSTHMSINPGQFVFGVVVTVIVIGFVIASRLIWSIESENVPVLLLKAASVICILIDVAASWLGTIRLISFDSDDPWKATGLALVVALTILSIIGLSTLLFDNDRKDKALSS